MNYNEFNGLGLLGQSIQCIKETNTELVRPTYDEFLENRQSMDETFTELLDKKTKIEPHISNSIDMFMEYFLNNVNETHYDSIKILEQRILTLDKALIILKNDYNDHYTKFLANFQNQDQFHEILTNYLYIKSMNEFLERFGKLIDELPKIPNPSLLQK